MNFPRTNNLLRLLRSIISSHVSDDVRNPVKRDETTDENIVHAGHAVLISARDPVSLGVTYCTKAANDEERRAVQGVDIKEWLQRPTMS